MNAPILVALGTAILPHRHPTLEPERLTVYTLKCMSRASLPSQHHGGTPCCTALVHTAVTQTRAPPH